MEQIFAYCWLDVTEGGDVNGGVKSHPGAPVDDRCLEYSRSLSCVPVNVMYAVM